MYPTQKELQKALKTSKPNPKLIRIIMQWKEKEYLKAWKKKTKKEKQNSITKLLITLNKQCQPKKKLIIKWHIFGWAYNQWLHTIYGEINNPSIISALHEFGHSLLGKSELKACAFSITHFQKCFPKEFTRLKWHKYMLTRK